MYDSKSESFDYNVCRESINNVARRRRLINLKRRITQGTIEARKQSFEVAQARIINGDGNRAMEQIRNVIDDIRTTETDIYRLEAVSSEGRLDVIQYAFTGALVDQIRESAHDNPSARIELKSLPGTSVDASMMHQVWFNLISNALKYSGKTENPAVGIGSFFNDTAVCYYVKDNGSASTFCFSLPG
jgi:light-regulated signal transduction histidine kinase (bacteriophytochrome)